MKVALIGHGRWGKNIAQTLSGFPEVDLEIVERGADASGTVDAVIIATPSATHAEIALPFVRAGVPVFIEKPMTTSLDDALKIRDTAHASGSYVQIGHIHLHNAAFQKARNVLPMLGELRSVVSECMNNNPRTDASIFWDWLPHDLSMMLTIVGEGPSGVQAISESGSGTYATALYRFKGVTLHSILSWESPHKRKCMTFVGEQGVLVFDDAKEKKLTLILEGNTSYPDYASTLPLTAELSEFISAVKQGSCRTDSLTMGLNVVACISAAEESVKRGGLYVRI